MMVQRGDLMNHVLLMLDKTVQQYPNKIAVIEENQSCTYKQLQKNSKAVASYLLQNSIRHRPVIVFMDKGILALYAFFGSAYSQNFYSLLNPEFPDSRLEQIQSVLQGHVVLTTKQYEEKAKQIFKEASVIVVESILSTTIQDELVNEAIQKTIDTDPLYVNFTSGSTGVPKGVLISHGSVIDFIETFVKTFSINKDERFGNQAPFDFDVSVKDIYSCLYTGATLIIIPRSYFSKPTALIDYLCEKQVTTLVWAVSALSLICTFHGLDYKVPKTVQKVLFSGEVMPYKHYQSWKKALPDALFVNLYGPTEITCNCTYHILDPDRDYTEGIPIGAAFANKGVFLLDAHDQKIIEPNEIGELCVKGKGLALGYYRNEMQTKAHFTQNPLQEAYFERIYRTGDLAYQNEKGEFVFKGRKDYQIKYLGHRIELEEIEKRALAIEGIEQCICLFDDVKHRLYGFYIGALSKEQFVTCLKKDLPSYMIPTRLFLMESMPLTKNGKTDRKALFELTKGKRR